MRYQKASFFKEMLSAGPRWSCWLYLPLFCGRTTRRSTLTKNISGSMFRGVTNTRNKSQGINEKVLPFLSRFLLQKEGFSSSSCPQLEHTHNYLLQHCSAFENSMIGFLMKIVEGQNQGAAVPCSCQTSACFLADCWEDGVSLLEDTHRSLIINPSIFKASNGISNPSLCFECL